MSSRPFSASGGLCWGGAVRRWNALRRRGADRRGEGKGEDEGGALAWSALHANVATVGLDDEPADVQPQPHPIRALASARAVVLGEEALTLLGGQPLSLV